MQNEIFNQYIVLKKYINEKDYEEINKLSELCIKHDNINLKLELEYRLQARKDYEKNPQDINEFLYYVNDSLIGYIGIASFGGNLGEINGLVHPQWRRKGIFKKLCNLAVEESEKRDFTKILLLCDDKSTTAVNFINSTGAVYDFSECGMKLSGKAIDVNDSIISLRKATNADGQEIGRQNSIYFGDVENKITFPEEEEKNNAITYMVELDGRIIGKIKVHNEEDSAFISGFGIIPEYRGKGYGKAALKEALNMINRNNIYEIALDVAVENKNALNLYKNCGFVEKSIMNYYKIMERS
jgi:ribosomal protein S18 acetylase RimI-like enzyme